MAMNPIVKARWVAALRSGDYQQTIGTMNRDGSFCCLGVLCDLYVKEGRGEWQEDPGLHKSRLDGMASLPPKGVCEWAGITNYGHIPVSIDETTHTLPQHNDGRDENDQPIPRRTFAEIADAIEAQL